MTPDPIAWYCTECALGMLGRPASGLCIVCEMELHPNDPPPARKPEKEERRGSKSVMRGYRP